MGKLLLLAAVLLLAGGIFFGLRSGLIRLPGSGGDQVEVSQEAAAAAEEKLTALQAGGTEARLTGTELTSLFRFRPEIWSMGAVLQPQVRMNADTISIAGKVATAQLPPDPEIEAIRMLLPDTADVAVTGTMHPGQRGNATLEIFSMEVAGMPVPRRYYPMILERVGNGDAMSSDSATVTVPLPAEVSSARVENGELVLTP
jgi:hypothetical protein